MSTRKEFLKHVGISSAVLMTSPAFSFTTPAERGSMPLGLASYTLRKFSVDDVIKICVNLGLTDVSLKSVHLPLEASEAAVKEIAAKVRAAGLNLYGGGVIYMKTAAEVENTFRYASYAGLEMVVGAPNHELLPLVGEQVKKYNIKLAIHNHGPGDSLYTSPNDVYEKVKSLDKRIGLCIDIGHVVRIGQDPIPMIEKYSDRLYDMHMKDEDKAVADGQPIEIGRGVINIPGVVKALRKIDYKGHIAFEYEKNGDDPVPGLAESVGYVRGIMKMVS